MLRWPVSLQPRLMKGWCRGLGGREPGVPGLSTPGRRLPRGGPPFFRVKMTRSVSWGCHDNQKLSDSTPAVCALRVPESEAQNHAAGGASPLPPLNGKVLLASCWLPAPGSRLPVAAGISRLAATSLPSLPPQPEGRLVPSGLLPFCVPQLSPWFLLSGKFSNSPMDLRPTQTIQGHFLM